MYGEMYEMYGENNIPTIADAAYPWKHKEEILELLLVISI